MVYRPARYQPVKSRMISAEPIDAISAPTHAAMSEKRLNRGACERNQGCILHTSSALRMASTPLHTSLSSPKTPPDGKEQDDGHNPEQGHCSNCDRQPTNGTRWEVNRNHCSSVRNHPSKSTCVDSCIEFPPWMLSRHRAWRLLWRCHI